MKERDAQILSSLSRFRVMTRDQILKLHFEGILNKVSNGNTVLKRLTDRGYITVNKDFRPYIYFPNPPTIKTDSTKLLHFLEIVNVYLALREIEEPSTFISEPKFKKGYVEPDIFCLFKGIPIFFEVQLSLYSRSMIESKLNAYRELYESDIIKNESWQHPNKIIYPPVVLISHHRYDVSVPGLKVLQYQSIKQFIDHINYDKQKAQ
ncbi:hypothetical protein PDK93_25400 [Bacillus cereus]|nr:hypothetical protein [Bacillus cereus]